MQEMQKQQTSGAMQSQSHVSEPGRGAIRKQGSRTEREHLPGDQPGCLETGKKGRVGWWGEIERKA